MDRCCLIRDANNDGTWESIQPFCSDVKNVQGILSLGNRVFVVGDGPQGGALYQINDDNNDGRSDKITPIVRFRGQIGEHGPHTVRLGPDGLLYLLSGNFSQPDAQLSPRSPYAHVYEGDLIVPRYEDPNGHAVGVPAPGGSIYRTDMSGSFVERVVAGFRNPYDFAFNGDGEIFTYDADMEWDIGAPWYRPTRVIHAPPGGEFGWRSGWAKSPAYFVDTLPATLDVGAGSPTGVVFYDHTNFPVRLQNTFFIGDWATGQIHAVKLDRSGATYTAKMATFVKGRPLNVTSLDVGPDGALYFATGGRGTDGGIYRVRWTGNAPPPTVHQGIDQALYQPQLQSDWARRRIAAVKRGMGDRWQTELQRSHQHARIGRESPRAGDRAARAIRSAADTRDDRRASRDPEPAVRVRAVRMMGAQTQADFSQPLTTLLGDTDPWVRRVACEAIAHRGSSQPVDALVGLLNDPDRFVAFSARRALETVPPAQWQDKVLTAATSRTFLQGATGLLIAHPSPQVLERILARCDTLIRGQVNDPGMPRGQISDANFLDLLRVLQLAFIRGPLGPSDIPSLTEQLVREYPTRDVKMNRELVKILAYLQPPEAPRAVAKQLEADIPDAEKLHIAAYAARITTGWTTAEKLVMLRYYEQARGITGGHSLSGYIEGFARDFFTNLTLVERQQVLAAGESFPSSALSVLAKLPENAGPEVLAEIRALDQRLEGKTGEPIARLRVGIAAVLGRSGQAESLAYLRNVYLRDPLRRAPVAMSLTQHPDGENWAVLVDSLRTMEGEPAKEVLTALAKVRQRPETSEPYRNTILLGLRLGTGGGELAVRLLEQWLGQTPGSYRPDAPLENQLCGVATMVRHDVPQSSARPSCPRKLSRTSGATKSSRVTWKRPKAAPVARRAARRYSPMPSASTATASTTAAKALARTSRRRHNVSNGKKSWNQSSIRTRSFPTSTPARS